MSLPSLFVAVFSLVSFVHYHVWPPADGLLSLVSLFHYLCAQLVLLFITWYTVKFTYYHLQRQPEVCPAGRAVLVTGCDTGFGNLIAKRLDKRGFFVYAGVLKADGADAKQLRDACSQRLTVVQMDVTRPEDVQKTVDLIAKSGRDLWAVINNAGIATFGPAEWGPNADDCRRIFDVNVFGSLTVIKSCLPMLKKTGGRVINVTSAAGYLTLPYFTSYSMSKHAFRSLSNGLRNELAEFGVRVVTIEPIVYRTNIAEVENAVRSLTNLQKRTPDQVLAAYGSDMSEKITNMWATFLGVGRDKLDEVIDAMEVAVVVGKPKSAYRCTGPGDYVFFYVVERLPDELFDWFIWVTFTLSNSRFHNLLMKIINFCLHLKVD